MIAEEARDGTNGRVADRAAAPGDETLWKQLAAPFPKNETGMVPKGGISVSRENRERGKALGARYLDAAAVTSRLDAVVGPARWSFAVVPHVVTEDKVVVEGALAIDVDGAGHWVSKSDVGQGVKRGGTDGGASPFKSAVSDALKRAAALWGIGRYLRHEQTEWLPCKIWYDRKDPDKPKFGGWIEPGERGTERGTEQKVTPPAQRAPARDGAAPPVGARPAQGAPVGARQDGPSRAGAPDQQVENGAAKPGARPILVDQTNAIARLARDLNEEVKVPETEAEAGRLITELQAKLSKLAHR